MNRSPDQNQAPTEASFRQPASLTDDELPTMSNEFDRCPSGSSASFIELRGVRVHNLKNVDLDIPLNQLVVLSGVSGSGKSSLAFDTIFAEGQRRYIEGFSLASRRHLERIERPDADRIAHIPVTLGIRNDSSAYRSNTRSTVATIAELLDGLRLLYSRIGQIVCPTCDLEIRTHSAADIVSTIGDLPTGTRCQLVFEIGDRLESESAANWLARGFSRGIWDGQTHHLTSDSTWPKEGTTWLVADRLLAGKATPERIRESAEFAFREGRRRCLLLIESSDQESREPPTELHCLIDGKTWQISRFSQLLECPNCQRQFLSPEPRLFSHFSVGACLVCRGTGCDQNQAACAACKGTRYRDEALAVKIGQQNIADLCRQNASTVLSFMENLKRTATPDQLAHTNLIRADIERRFCAVRDLGLDYLTLNRPADTLSGGEFRRLSLAAVIGSKITGTLVVVDEPSAGLSQPELPNVIRALRRILSQRNSVIVVDHSPTIVAAADHVIELGPGAGPAGGNIVYQGRPDSEHFTTEPPVESATLQFQGTQKIRSPSAAQLQPIQLTRVCHHNLQNFAVEFPLGKLCVVTGPNGAGKTSLVTQVLYPAVCHSLGLPCVVKDPGTCEIAGCEQLTDVVLIDQSPLTKSSRSNPATWLEVFDEIRETFAATADAKHRGFTAIQFSFNSSNGGRCRSCLGTGLLKHDMQFLPDLTLTCPECNGARYRPEILEVKYRGCSIADVLAMSISEAASFFRSQPRLQSRFQILKQIGLDYLVLGQPSETLSGGEAQRLKLAARIVKPVAAKGLFICDEPTTGLHPADVRLLVACFRELLANGQSLILADNSPELREAADFVVNLSLPG